MSETGPVLLYDGVCVLCSGAVAYTLKYERDAAIRFVAIQSEWGRQQANAHGIDPENPASFLFLEGGIAYDKSDGVLALIRHLRGPANLLRIGVFLPKRLRDAMYDLIARNRYQIFGKHTACLLPDAAQRHRFIVS